MHLKAHARALAQALLPLQEIGFTPHSCAAGALGVLVQPGQVLFAGRCHQNHQAQEWGAPISGQWYFHYYKPEAAGTGGPRGAGNEGQGPVGWGGQCPRC